MDQTTATEVNGSRTAGEALKERISDAGTRLRRNGWRPAAGIAAGTGALGLTILGIRRRRRAKAAGPLKAAAGLPGKLIRGGRWKKPAMGIGVAVLVRKVRARRRAF